MLNILFHKLERSFKFDLASKFKDGRVSLTQINSSAQQSTPATKNQYCLDTELDIELFSITSSLCEAYSTTQCY